MANANELRRRILELVREFHAAEWPALPVEPGPKRIPASGKVFDADALEHLVDAALDFWLTTGRFAERFERSFAEFSGLRHCMLVNSGSSANLLAITALTAPEMGERRLRPGDEVITCAVGFPTTIAPIVQAGLTPVFVDVDIPTYNADPDELIRAIGPRTRAIFLAHTLGNPYRLDVVMDLVRRHDLWLIEDICDAVGSTWEGRLVGTFGDAATVSFYPAHHLTMGEGGAVLTDDARLKRVVESLRDWGRDCWCDPGRDNTCGKRFGWQLGELPDGYDHKYTYSRLGYNLKMTDLQAAVGVAQLVKLPRFIERRRENFAYLQSRLSDLEDILELPAATKGSLPSWFGYPITVRPNAGLTRLELVRYLEDHGVGTRLVFGGNLVRQPALRDVPCRVVGDLARADRVMRDSFWVGVFPGLERPHLDYVVDCVHTALARSTAGDGPS